MLLIISLLNLSTLLSETFFLSEESHIIKLKGVRLLSFQDKKI